MPRQISTLQASVGTRLRFAFFISLFTMLIMGGLTWFSFEYTHQHINALVKQDIPKIHHSLKLAEIGTRLEAFALAIPKAKNIEEITFFRENLIIRMSDIQKFIAQLLELKYQTQLEQDAYKRVKELQALKENLQFNFEQLLDNSHQAIRIEWQRQDFTKQLSQLQTQFNEQFQDYLARNFTTPQIINEQKSRTHEMMLLLIDFNTEVDNLFSANATISDLDLQVLQKKSTESIETLSFTYHVLTTQPQIDNSLQQIILHIDKLKELAQGENSIFKIRTQQFNYQSELTGMIADIRNYTNLVRVTIDSLVELIDKNSQENSNSALEFTTYATQYILALSVIGILISLFLNLQVANNITNGLSHISAMSQAMLMGKLSELSALRNQPKVAALCKQRDEVGEIGRAFDSLSIYFETLISDIVYALQCLADGDLNVNPKVEYRGDFRQVEKSLTRTLHDLRIVINDIVQVSNDLADGKAFTRPLGNYRGEFEQIKFALMSASKKLIEATEKNKNEDWFKTGLAKLNEEISGEQELSILAKKIITFLATYLEFPVGALYVAQEADGRHSEAGLQLMGSFALQRRKHSLNYFAYGEGLVGQAGLEKQMMIVRHLPTDYLEVQSGIGSVTPHFLFLIPFLFEGELKGILEFASFIEIKPAKQQFLEQVATNIGIAINTAQSRFKMQLLLQQTQSQKEELQSQAEELQAQQEELRQANEELQERTKVLEDQKKVIQESNLVLEKNQNDLARKAQELTLASQYKSEFLANMSHELRTPLNSLLILTQLLLDNKQGNLETKQLDYLKTIHNSGNELLSLINDILDLSKVEAGKLEIHYSDLAVQDLMDNIEAKFRPVAETKHLAFEILVNPLVPTVIKTDEQRLKQILNNLLSNAFKFTSQGTVRIIFHLVEHHDVPQKLAVGNRRYLVCKVTDTGIGIAPDKQKLIFEAFQQADGTTSRRYGGTGLGLSIARQLAHLLEGDLELSSELNKGSVFSLYLPLLVNAGSEPLPPVLSLTESDIVNDTPNLPALLNTVAETNGVNILNTDATLTAEFVDVSTSKAVETTSNESFFYNKEAVFRGKRILIVDDDMRNSFSTATLLEAHDMEVFVASEGEEAIRILTQPPVMDLILMDVMMPVMDGYQTMRRIRQELNLKTPIIALTAKAMKDEKAKCIEAGANDYLTKPVDVEHLLNLIRVWLSEQVFD